MCHNSRLFYLIVVAVSDKHQFQKTNATDETHVSARMYPVTPHRGDSVQQATVWLAVSTSSKKYPAVGYIAISN